MSLVAMISVAALGGGVATAVAAHDFFEGETLLADLLRARRLASLDLTVLDRRAAGLARGPAVVTLTTIPSRIELIAMTLKSLLDQTVLPARIRLNVPYHSRRENRDYQIPGWLEGLQMVEIVRCDDFGPATKLFPTLGDAAADDPLVVVDDDRLYPPGFIADLTAAAARDPDSAQALSG